MVEEVPILSEFKYHEHVVVLLEELVELDDVRVAQLGVDLLLPLDATQLLGVHLLKVYLLHFDRHFLLILLVIRFVDLGEGALAEKNVALGVVYVEIF